MRQVLTQTRYALWSLFNREYLRPTYKLVDFNELVIPKDVRLVILDKDNCFTKPHSPNVWPAFKPHWDQLWQEQKEKDYQMVVVSNSAGDLTVDTDGSKAQALEEHLGVPVLRHAKRKPLCYKELSDQFAKEGYKPDEIMVVGDRLFTDILMANLMGARSAWVYPGVHPGFLNKFEWQFYTRMDAKKQ